MGEAVDVGTGFGEAMNARKLLVPTLLPSPEFRLLEKFGRRVSGGAGTADREAPDAEKVFLRERHAVFQLTVVLGAT
ncbi:MAG: hypothetical protein M3069_30820 [Chloroflexota bacterium]|nr:hypothetical protein [Chloroflexota bacterium]